jgi:hypothetical protein
MIVCLLVVLFFHHKHVICIACSILLDFLVLETQFVDCSLVNLLGVLEVDVE